MESPITRGGKSTRNRLVSASGACALARCGLLLLVWFCGARAWAATHQVESGQKIQDAISKASPGDTILVMPGIYREALHVDKPNVTIRGVIQGGVWPRLEGGHELNDGIIVSGAGFVAEYLHIANFKGNGVTTQGADNVVLRRLIVDHAGIYGIYPTLGRNITVEGNIAFGIADAAIYIGMCTHVDVRDNVVYQNVAGIEIENSEHVLIENNNVYDNTAGILVFALPGLPRKKAEDVIIRKNFVDANNHRNFGEIGSVVANVPPGVGILLLAADHVTIEDNIIRDNKLAGVVLASLDVMPGMTPDPEVDPGSDHNAVLANIFQNNARAGLRFLFTWYHYIGRNLFGGGSPQGTAEDLWPRGADLVFVGKGRENCVWAHGAQTQLGGEGIATCDAGRATGPLATMRSAAAVATTYEDPGEEVYATVCAGCHAANIRLIGPPVSEIRAKYAGNPDGIVAYATQPQAVRANFPPMPPQGHLGEEKLKAVAAFLLR